MFDLAKPEKQSVLNTMKSEFLHRFKISSDIFIDSIATKTIFDEMAFKTSGKIKGYMSNVGLDPFGYLLFSKIQVIDIDKKSFPFLTD